MTRLSVNINKIATIRNSRGGNIPDVVKAAINIEKYGAEGITVHPRPDERHIRYNDVLELKKVITTEFNIEGYPSERFMELVLKVVPEQVTLVPDAHDAITSNEGWNTIKYQKLLSEVVARLKEKGIRVSVFVDPMMEMIDIIPTIGADRIELYTEPYVSKYSENKEAAIAPYINAAHKAKQLGIGINAGHDLNLDNLHFFVTQIPFIDEVSIGHALISDALYFGLENTVQLYKRQLLN